MDLDSLKLLIKYIGDSTLNYFMLESADLKLIMAKTSCNKHGIDNKLITAFDEIAATKDSIILTSHLVGNFQNTSPLLTKGSKVKKGQILYAIESLNIINEIKSELDGIIVETFVAHKEFVDYGKKIMEIQAD